MPLATPQLSDVHELVNLLQADAQNELRCRDFLRCIPQHLCWERPRALLRIGCEEPGRFGSCDFVVSAEISHGAASERIAYVWELKAPQIYLYEMDRNVRRFRPTTDLIRAETQLLHYVADMEYNTLFRGYYLLHPTSKVLPAGIIIGREDRFARVGRRPVSEISLDQDYLARASNQIRLDYIYNQANIRIKTWDWVLELITPPPKVHVE